jgi:hypothetical protein
MPRGTRGSGPKWPRRRTCTNVRATDGNVSDGLWPGGYRRARTLHGMSVGRAIWGRVRRSDRRRLARLKPRPAAAAGGCVGSPPGPLKKCWVLSGGCWVLGAESWTLSEQMETSVLAFLSALSTQHSALRKERA